MGGLRTAPILQDVAGALAGLEPSTLREDPLRWAYALRDAVALAPPAVVVSHLDPALEADALAAAVDGEGDWVERLDAAPALEGLAPASAAVELVRTLAGVHRGGPAVAATLSGPGTVAARLAPVLGVGSDPDARAELADLAADALAGIVAAYVDAGAELVIVVENDEGNAEAHGPLVRALRHHRLEGVVLGSAVDGYEIVAERWNGEGPAPGGGGAALDATLWALEPAAFAECWQRVRAAEPGLLLSAGAVPADAPRENLRTAAA